MKPRPFIAIHVVPTGIGCSIGGFAGDAAPANKLLASCVDYLIANPNVVNAATLHNIPENMVYAEGFSIDSLCKEEILLRPRNNNRIGVVFDRAISQDVLNVNINAINACRVVYGLEITGYILTEKPVDVEYHITEDKISSGTIKNTHSLLRACQKMIEKGAEALAVVCYFPEFEGEDNYSEGFGVDPVGGVEAIISHLVSYELGVPCAHAPAFSFESSLPSNNIVDPRAASEYISPSFLPCVLAGLRQAPLLIKKAEAKDFDISIDDISLLIVPYNALGSIPLIKCLEKKIPVISIKDNRCVLDVTAAKLGVVDKIIELQSYLEACGYIMALRQGISPQALLRPIQKASGI